MTSRGRGGSWDPMRDDYDNSYSAYPDEETSVQLDLTKLYVTKLPAALSQEGFVTLFSKYGRVVHSYFSKDPNKNYAFVTFETSGEAKIAMMKLHNTEPFNLCICFAHNKNTKTQSSQHNVDGGYSNTERPTNRHSHTVRHNHAAREDSMSVSSRGHRPRNEEEHANGNEDGDETEESDGGIDPGLAYDLMQLKHQQLQIKAEQLKFQKQMMIFKQMKKNATLPVTKRRLLPDGQIQDITQEIEASITTGGGDSRHIPGLQRKSSRRCVSCDAHAELYCAGCKVTPYCSEQCQRRDWQRRHRAVCHNLSRLSSDDAVKPAANGLPESPASVPPRSPAKSPRDPPVSDSGSERGQKFIPPAERHAAHQQAQQRRANNMRNDNRNQCDEGQNRNHGSQNENKRDNQGGQEENSVLRNQVASSRRHTPIQCAPLRQPVKVTPEAKPIQEPAPQVETKAASPKPKMSVAGIGSAGDVTPRKPLVPTSYVVEKLPVGASFLAEAMALATDCGSKQPGFVCLTLHELYSEMYDKLCEEFKLECQKDTEEYTPSIGETFAYYCEEDGFWYRARCLSRTRAALLDAGRVVSLSQRAGRRLPADYRTIPEFMAVLKTNDLTIGGSLSCTVTNASSGIRVSVQDASGATVEVDATRWLPEVEYPTEPQRPLRQPQLNQPTIQQTVKPAQVEPLQVIIKNPKVETQVVEPTPQVKPSVRERVVDVKPEPREPLVPASYVVEKLPVGSLFLAEAIALPTNCSSTQPGFICLTLNELYSEMYDKLCEDFKGECQKDTDEYMPSIGETFAYYCEEDGFWYRARCLSRTRAALLDAGRVVSLSQRASRRLPTDYRTIPEFMAVLKTDDLTIGDNLSCTVVSVAPSCIRVCVETSSGKSVEVDATRWLPTVEYPPEPVAAPIPQKTAPIPQKTAPIPQKTAPIPQKTARIPQKTAPITVQKAALPPTVTPTPTVPPSIPEVPRPSISHNNTYVLLDVTSLRRACVRPCDPRLAALFDSVLQDTLLYAVTATPLKEPPMKGQTVVAKFIEDGTHYRAFVKRVNVAMNKYLIEYIEYGNEEIVPLERLYPCPPKLQLDEKPAQASLIKLSDREPSTLTQAAVKYIENLKDNAIELILTIPGGVKTAPSGSIASLLVAKNCEAASKRIEELCTPEWRKLLEKGGDVLEMEPRFYHQLKYSSIPTSRPFILRVTFCDIDTLSGGVVSGHEKGDKSADLVYGELTKQITEYCESSLCREPYMPRLEELCITRNKRLNKWVRSVLVALPNGPGSKTASVLHIDYGDLEDVSVADIRKMAPEFVDRYAATAQHFEIKDFPHNKVSRAQLERAMVLMRVTAEGEGLLRVSSCREIEENMYEFEAPELIDALTQ